MNKEEKKQDYWTRHPNCRKCIWYRTRMGCFGEFFITECSLKDTWIKHPKIKARLCKYYEYKKENKE